MSLRPLVYTRCAQGGGGKQKGGEKGEAETWRVYLKTRKEAKGPRVGCEEGACMPRGSSKAYRREKREKTQKKLRTAKGAAEAG